MSFSLMACGQVQEKLGIRRIPGDARPPAPPVAARPQRRGGDRPLRDLLQERANEPRGGGGGGMGGGGAVGR